MQTKRCPKCGEVKGLEEFHRSRRKASGRVSYCRLCQAARGKAWYKANKDWRLARNKAWYEANRELIAARRKANRELIAARNKAWREANRERYSAHRKAWYKANRELVAARMKVYYEGNRDQLIIRTRTWAKANPEKARLAKQAGNRRRQARKYGVPSVWITRAMKAAMYEAQGGLCYYGREELNGSYHLEHKIPLKRGGSHTLDNVVLACKTCNARKGTKTDIEFLAFLAGG